MIWIPLVLSKPELGVKKSRGNDIEWSNLGRDQTTHFVGDIESPNVENSYYNCKKIGITFDARPTLCVSSVNKEKTQIGQANA